MNLAAKLTRWLLLRLGADLLPVEHCRHQYAHGHSFVAVGSGRAVCVYICAQCGLLERECRT